jgi:hypothetical protein
MHKTSSPGRAEARGSNSGDRENQNLDAQLLPDPALIGNTRRLIRVEGGAPLYEVFTISSYFELVSGSEKWRFNELWEGIVQQIRLAAREGAQ